MVDTHTDIANLEAKLDGGLNVLANSKNDRCEEELEKAGDDFRAVLFEVARNPISQPAQLRILNKSIGYLLTEEPEPFHGSHEDAIDAALEEAIAEASSPRQTALLSLVRYRIEEQRQAAA